MACKRTATSDLNHENWDNEDEPEEAGTFVKATQDVLKKRVVKSARRRLARSGEPNTKSAFGLFSGFKTAAPTSLPQFSFLTKPETTTPLAATSSTFGRSVASTASNGERKTPENGTDPSGLNPTSKEETVGSRDMEKCENSEKEDKIFKKSSDYFAKLKGLNESVTQWIKSHVDSNPFCILTPIFRDYEKYLKEIEGKRALENLERADSEIVMDKPLAASSELCTVSELEKTRSNLTSDEKKFSFFDTVKTPADSNTSMNQGSTGLIFGGANTSIKSSFASTTEKKEDEPTFGSINTDNNLFLNKTRSPLKVNEDSEKSKTEKSLGFGSFGQLNAASATFSFGQSSSIGSTPTSGFSFGSAKPFSFGSHVAAPQNSETKADTEDKEDEEEVPKPDFKPITEEDAFFEKRCKVFVKKDGNFSDRGIGVLFLKKTPNGKTQLIVRADNSLGNLLLNTLLTSSIPTKRMNKNTVMLVCLPLPESEPPPTPVLLRVKTSEDADNLIETLDNNKK